ncbi:hypothetical protein JI435_411820, partial [Parastagonospora nodorum SN15]
TPCSSNENMLHQASEEHDITKKELDLRLRSFTYHPTCKNPYWSSRMRHADHVSDQSITLHCSVRLQSASRSEKTSHGNSHISICYDISYRLDYLSQLDNTVGSRRKKINTHYIHSLIYLS